MEETPGVVNHIDCFGTVQSSMPLYASDDVCVTASTASSAMT